LLSGTLASNTRAVVQRMRLGAGPLTAAAAALTEGEAPSAPADPAAFLARLMDLRGSIDLARRLAAAERALPASAPEPAARERLRILVGERLGGVRADLERTFAEPFQRRNKLPGAAEAYAALAQAGALAERGGRPLTAAVDALWAPFGDLVTRALERVRFETAALREEIAPALTALGPAAARLERLDAALSGATAQGRRGIEDRLLPALARSFAAQLRVAVTALPEPATAADLAPWFAPAGWVRVEVGRGRAVVEAVFVHERRRIDALAEPG
jgi:hypothetical protein